MEEYQVGPGRVWKPETAGERAYLPEPLEPERLPAPAGRDGPVPVRPRAETGGPELETVVLTSAEAESKKEEAETKEAVPAETGPESKSAESEIEAADSASAEAKSKKAEIETAVSVLSETEPKKEETVPVETGPESKSAESEIETAVSASAETETKKTGTEAKKPLSNEAVTGHTASLWKYLPVPAEEPEPAPETLRLYQKYGGGVVTAARVRGKKHKHEGTNCDDWYEVSGFQNLLLAAVSDGAGSKRFSRIGARESCRAAAGCLRRELEGLWTPELAADAALDICEPRCMAACTVLAGAVQRSVLKAREAVEAAFYTRVNDPAYEAVLGRPLELRDLSATLLVTVVIPSGAGGRLVISCQVGDGMIALVDRKGPFEGSVRLMGTADSGEFSGETEFLVSPKMSSLEALQSRTKLSWSRSDLLLMMTDGVSDDYFPHETELRRLYFDLVANGILEGENPGELTEERLRLCRKLPQPLSYPWVNDQRVQVPLHYTRRILETAGLTREDLWRDGTALAAARAELEEQLALPDPARRLERWLDNYVERGSFDDRTLVIAELT